MSYRLLRRTADSVLVTYDVLFRAERRYADCATTSTSVATATTRRLSLLRWVPGWSRDLTASRAGGGWELRRELGAWVLRPRAGWRSFWFTWPSFRNATIGRRDRDGADRWMMALLHRI